MILCGIIGWKNSGKTFLAQKIVKYFSDKNYNVALIKHAHHNFDLDKPQTDSFLLRKAGAKQVIISSSKRWAKITELKKDSEKTLSDLLKDLDNPDIVIIEGFKKLPHSKIEVIRNNTKNHLFKDLNNIIGIVSDDKIDTLHPLFKFDQIKEIADLILNKAKNE